LRIVFPSREAAVMNVLALADVVQIVSPAELPAAIVEQARHALARFDVRGD